MGKTENYQLKCYQTITTVKETIEMRVQIVYGCYKIYNVIDTTRKILTMITMLEL